MGFSVITTGFLILQYHPLFDLLCQVHFHETVLFSSWWYHHLMILHCCSEMLLFLHGISLAKNHLPHTIPCYTMGSYNNTKQRMVPRHTRTVFFYLQKKSFRANPMKTRIRKNSKTTCITISHVAAVGGCIFFRLCFFSFFVHVSFVLCVVVWIIFRPCCHHTSSFFGHRRRLTTTAQ